MGNIRLDHVTKRFEDVTAVDDVDIEIRDGELLVLVGPSGCGKTTLLRTIAGLETPTQGDVFIGGQRMTDIPARKRDVALVFQNFALFPHMSARENVSFNLRMQGDMSKAEIEDRVDEIAELLDIQELLDRAISELSGGQKQRVSLGRAIVTNPAAFMLDEPLANLDANLRDRMQTEIVRLQKQLEITTIHVTHNQSEAMTMGDRIAVMNDGRLQQLGEPEDVYYRPANLFVAQFIGSPDMNLIEATYRANDGFRIDSDGDTVRVPTELAGVPGTDLILGCRPEHVAVSFDEESGDEWLTTEVQFSEFHGADRYLFLRAPEGMWNGDELVARLDSDVPVERGDRVSVRFNPEQVHPFDPETTDRIPPTDRENWDSKEPSNVAESH